MKTAAVVLSTTLCLLATSAAYAQRIVFDPSNFSQNILTAARALQQINNQVRQLQNEAQMLANQSRNLTPLSPSVLAELQAALSASSQLIQQGRGLAFNIAQMDADFQRLYPEAYTASISGVQMTADRRERWLNSLEALRTATRIQSQAVQNFAVDEQALVDLVTRSQSAVGALQAAQATNQLLALQVRQAIQAQQLQLTQDRASAMEQARQVAVQERAREVRRRFLGEGTAYTPRMVDFYSE